MTLPHGGQELHHLLNEFRELRHYCRNTPHLHAYARIWGSQALGFLNVSSLTDSLTYFVVQTKMALHGGSRVTEEAYKNFVPKGVVMTACERDSLDGHCFANQSVSSRRGFLKESAALTAGFSALLGASLMPESVHASDSNLNILGPRPGFGPQLGTFVSMLT